MKAIKIGKQLFGGKGSFFVIAGPCVIEDEKSLFSTAKRLKEITRKLNLPFIFKTSYDKANRSSLSSYRGPGLKKGLDILARLKKELGLLILSDVHSAMEIGPASKVLDIIQIPALLSRQTDLISAAAKTGKPINIKKGQYLAPWDIENVIGKITSAGNRNIIITERGVSFGYNNLVSDMRAIPIIKSFGYPVVYDATHSVQLPGGAGSKSGGERQFVPALARAAVAAGCDGVFLEVHHNPDKALCDGPNMLPLESLQGLLKTLKQIHKIVS
ncbi:MAG: 3-deoxy-8-phosphooctulonate synthase [Planctomycetes bacterium]|nr:3-deoxy-8-phosphooctulonate synthase [Planctomycetota bacterium]